jgi:hypothetical protein
MLQVCFGSGHSNIVCVGCSLFDFGSEPGKTRSERQPALSAIANATFALIQHRAGVAGGDERPGWYECGRSTDPEQGRLGGQRGPGKVVCRHVFPALRTEVNRVCCRRASFMRLAVSNIFFLLAAYLGKAVLNDDTVLWAVVEILAVGAAAAFVWSQYRGQWQAGKSIEVRRTVSEPGYMLNVSMDSGLW